MYTKDENCRNVAKILSRISFHIFGLEKMQKINLENIKEAIKKLAEKEQNIIIMRFIEGFSPKETAKILEKSEISIRVTQNRAIKKLKKILENESPT